MRRPLSRFWFLEPKDLRLLGTYYQSGPRLVVSVSSESVAIVPRPLSTVFIAATLSLPMVACAFSFIFGWTGAVEKFGLCAGPMFALTGLLAIGGPIAMEFFRHKYLESRSADYCVTIGLLTPFTSSLVEHNIQRVTFTVFWVFQWLISAGRLNRNCS